MKKEYDFSNAERGKFYRPGVKLNIPVYLHGDAERYAREKARSQGVDVEELVNDILKQQAIREGYLPV